MRSRSMSARSVSAWELTETYSPAAIDMAPATKPATPATKTSWLVACAAATPTTRLAVDTMPSFAPSTAARNHPMRSVRCRSLWGMGILTFLIGCDAKSFRRRPSVFTALLCGKPSFRLVNHLDGLFLNLFGNLR